MTLTSVLLGPSANTVAYTSGLFISCVIGPPESPPDDRPELARELGSSPSDVRVAGGDPPRGLHHQRHRTAQLQPAQDTQESGGVSQRGGRVPPDLPRAAAGEPEMDDADPELEDGAATTC